MVMTPEQLAEIETRASKATKGPWFSHATDDDYAMNARYVGTEFSDGHHDHKRGMSVDPADWQSGTTADYETVVAITLLQHPRIVCVGDDNWDENTDFIAAARQDVPALCQALREAWADARGWRMRVDEAAAVVGNLEDQVERLRGGER